MFLALLFGLAGACFLLLGLQGIQPTGGRVQWDLLWSLAVGIVLLVVAAGIVRDLRRRKQKNP